MPDKIVIIGAGGVGREVAATLSHTAFSHFEIAGFIDDATPADTLINTIPVLGSLNRLIEREMAFNVVIAIGNPKIREQIATRLSAFNFTFPSIIHPNVSIHNNTTVAIGQGCYFADGCVLTTDIAVEDFCFINTSCSLQHDTVVGAYSVLMPGVRVTGGAKIGAGSYIAANCAITTACTIEKNSVIKNSIY